MSNFTPGPWKVIAGQATSYFPTLKNAKTFARQYIFAQIIDELGFVRYISRAYRIFKI